MNAFFRAKTIEGQIEALSPTPDGQLPAASINARLIRDLALVYDHPSYAQHLDHSLAQVEQRLQARQIQHGDVAASAPPRAQSSHLANPPPARKRKQPQRTPSAPRRFAAALGSIAAVLCVAALLGSLVLALLATQHHGKTVSTTASQTPLPARSTAFASSTAVVGKAVALQTIHMFDARTGWAITSDNTRILHTTTGVTHWQDVSPVPITPPSILAGADFFSPATAWVAVASETGSLMYRTNDGGQTWQKASIPDQIVGNFQITFLNAQVGWLLVGKGAAAGSEAVDVLHTSDGGATWKTVSVTSYTNNRPTALPFGGDKSGISFVSATTGWATGLSATSNFVWLYVTHDSGTTWQHQSIPLAGNAGNGQIATMPPVFFNATDGILPVILAGLTNQATIIYVTHNGGISWNATAPVPIGAPARTIDFVDATHGWVAVNTDDVRSNQYTNSTVYRTTDGGQHWTPYTVKLSADMETLDFASPTQGWAIDSAQTLYRTANGGKTWTKVTPTVA